MGSVEKFPSSCESIYELSSPFRDALLERVSETENLIHLLYSPPFGTTKFKTLASVLCVTNLRWLIVTCDDNDKTAVAACTYGSTLLVELTLILLYGRLKIDFVENGKPQAGILHFNTVMHHIFSEAIQYILDAIDGKENVAMTTGHVPRAVVTDWPLKFRNYSIIHMPKKSTLLDGVCWKEIRAGFGRELAPAAALLVTDRHIIVIAEEKISGWFHFVRHAKYGAIITYFPLKRLADFRIEPHPRFCILQLEGHAGHGGEKLEIIFPPDRREAFGKVMAKAKAVREPVS